MTESITRGKSFAQSCTNFFFSKTCKINQIYQIGINLIFCTIQIKRDMDRLAFTDFVHEGSKIISSRPNDKEFIRNWRSFFGCSPEVCFQIWLLLKKHSFLPPRPKYCHFLWALLLLKTYSPDSVSCALVGGCDLKTWRKYSWSYIGYISELESKVVSLLVLHI